MKSLTSSASVADFLLTLYSAAQEKSVAVFPEFALAELKRFVEFDMALLGLICPTPDPLSSTGLSGIWTHVHREPSSMVEEWLSICSRDDVLENMFRALGQARSYHALSAFSRKEDAALLDFATRTRHLNILAVANRYGANDLRGAFSIRRADPRWRFTDRENALAQMLTPHFWEAVRINRTVMAAEAARIGGSSIKGLCVCDNTGLILFQDTAFERLRLTAFREPQNFRIPSELMQAFIQQRLEKWQDGRMVYTTRTVARLRFITATLFTGMEKLSVREKQIADFFGTGLTHAEISDELSIAGSTVRRHVESIYRKLGISTKADLSFLVHASRGDAVEGALTALEAVVLKQADSAGVATR